MIRILTLLALVAALGWWLRGEQQNGRFRESDERFLDFLLANTRDELKPDPGRVADVVFVRIVESDKGEYSAWPPAPIDYHLIIKALAPASPDVLAIAEPLSWPAPKPQFIDQLAQTLQPLPSVVLAVGGSEGAASQPVAEAFIKERLPVIARLQPAGDKPPWLAGITSPPEEALLRQGDAGIVSSYAALRASAGAVPSFETQVIARATRTPYSNQRVSAGSGAGLNVGDELFVPLTAEGKFPPAAVAVPEINALDLMTASITDDSGEIARTLGSHKVMVIGMDDARTRQSVGAVATALGLPRLRVLPEIAQLIASVIALSIVLWLLTLRRGVAFRTLLLLFAMLVASYLAFQLAKTWCPPAVPASIVLAGGVLSRLWARREKQSGAAAA